MLKNKYIFIILAITVLFCIFFLFCISTQKTQLSSIEYTLYQGNFFLLLKDEKTVSLNIYEDNEIKEQKIFSITNKTIYTTDQKEKAAFLNTAENIVLLYDIQTQEEVQLSIPYNINPITLLLNNGNLFIGGISSNNEMLIQYNLQNDSWYQLDIPKEVFLDGKAIDDLVVNDRFLIAVDNIVLPKYILFYDLNSRNKLRFSHFRELISNGAYERIHQARITPKYLGLYSTNSSGYTGGREHITIYNDLDLTSAFTISMPRVNIRSINDFLLVDDLLFIAHKENGLGIFEIRESYFKVNQYRYINSTRIEMNNINYIQFENEEILYLTLIPNETKLILTIKNSQGVIRNLIY